MENRKLKKYLQQNLQQEKEIYPKTARLEETISACIQIMQEQRRQKEGPQM